MEHKEGPVKENTMMDIIKSLKRIELNGNTGKEEMIMEIFGRLLMEMSEKLDRIEHLEIERLRKVEK